MMMRMMRRMPGKVRARLPGGRRGGGEGRENKYDGVTHEN